MLALTTIVARQKQIRLVQALRLTRVAPRHQDLMIPKLSTILQMGPNRAVQILQAQEKLLTTQPVRLQRTVQTQQKAQEKLSTRRQMGQQLTAQILPVLERPPHKQKTINRQRITMIQVLPKVPQITQPKIQRQLNLLQILVTHRPFRLTRL